MRGRKTLTCSRRGQTAASNSASAEVPRTGLSQIVRIIILPRDPEPATVTGLFLFWFCYVLSAKVLFLEEHTSKVLHSPIEWRIIKGWEDPPLEPGIRPPTPPLHPVPIPTSIPTHPSPLPIPTPSDLLYCPASHKFDLSALSEWHQPAADIVETSENVPLDRDPVVGKCSLQTGAWAYQLQAVATLSLNPLVVARSSSMPACPDSHHRKGGPEIIRFTLCL